MGNVIRTWLRKKGKLHFTLIDPDKQHPKVAGEIAISAENAGSDAIMVGGSTFKDFRIIEETVNVIKRKVSIPVILFPESSRSVVRGADYIFFMSLINSRSRKYLIGEQSKAIPLIERFDIKPISLAYLVISTSQEKTSVERKVSRIDVITEEDIEKAKNYALAAKYFGFQNIYLEAGSGAEKPVPNEMISAIKKAVKMPIIVGGGIRNDKIAKEKISAGADVIVTGTIAEKNLDILNRIIKSIKLMTQ
mgnify:CR=1 FL=1